MDVASVEQIVYFSAVFFLLGIAVGFIKKILLP